MNSVLLIVLLSFLSIPTNFASGSGVGGGTGGGGPSIDGYIAAPGVSGGGGAGHVIDTNAFEDERTVIISGGIWDSNEFDEDVFILDKMPELLEDYKLKIKLPNGDKREVKVLDVIDEEVIDLRESVGDHYLSHNKEEIAKFTEIVKLIYTDGIDTEATNPFVNKSFKDIDKSAILRALDQSERVIYAR